MFILLLDTLLVKYYGIKLTILKYYAVKVIHLKLYYKGIEIEENKDIWLINIYNKH